VLLLAGLPLWGAAMKNYIRSLIQNLRVVHCDEKINREQVLRNVGKISVLFHTVQDPKNSETNADGCDGLKHHKYFVSKGLLQ
jgi:hypothetical protein